MRILNWIKRKWYDHKAWKHFKQGTLRTYLREGFNEISYHGQPVVIKPEVDTSNSEMAKAVAELGQLVNDPFPPFDERAAKLEIIRKKAGI